MSEDEVIRVMLVDDVADTCDQLEKLLYFERDIEVVAKAGNGREAVELAKQKKPNVILMDINMPEMDGIAATEAIKSDDPTVQVIIMSVQGETDYLRKAMFAGASEFLVKPVGADDLYQSIREVYKKRPRGGPAQGHGVAEVSRTPVGEQGQLFAVYSPKGGTGTTTIASNLAIALRLMTQKKVVLVDGNLTMGDVNVVLNMVSGRNIVDIKDRIADLDADLLNDVLATHASQVKVLLAPPNPQDGAAVTEDELRSILNVLRAEYDYVVMDTNSSFEDKTVSVLDMADRIVVLMTLEMTCIKNIKLFMELTELLGFPREKLMLVLNKADNRMGIRVENVENNIQHKVVLQIANAPLEVTLSVNQGVPLVIGKRDHRASKDIFALARELARGAGGAKVEAREGKAEATPPGRGKDGDGGFFKRLFSQR